MNNNRTYGSSLRLAATLLLVGQLLYFVVTLFHTGGPANDHPTIFAAYAGSGTWTAVHVAQFACMAILIAGLLALSFALDVEAGTARWVGRLGGASALVALALYGALQRQSHHRRSGTQSAQPSRRSSLSIQREGEGEQSRDQDRHASELSDMDDRPARAAGIGGEDDGVVIGWPTGVEQGDHHVQDLSHEQQRGGQA